MKRQNISVYGFIGLSATLLGTGCSDVDQPTDEDYDEVAQSIAPLVQQDISNNGTVELAVDLSTGNAPFWLTVDAQGGFQGTSLGLAWNIELSCEDVDGNSLELCDETTDAARFRAGVNGGLDTGNFQASLAFDSEWEISGLQSDEVTITARTQVDAETDFMSVFRPVMSSFDLNFEAGYDLTVPTTDSGAARGSADAVVDVRRVSSGTNAEVDAHFIIDVEASFDGEGRAVVILDGGAMYDLNLTTGNIDRM